jgi:hypothetical protein
MTREEVGLQKRRAEQGYPTDKSRPFGTARFAISITGRRGSSVTLPKGMRRSLRGSMRKFTAQKLLSFSIWLGDCATRMLQRDRMSRINREFLKRTEIRQGR